MKKINFIIILLMTIIILTSCTKNNENSPSVKTEGNNSPENLNNVEPKNETPVEKPIPKDPIKEIDMSLKPNEIGEIMILMYHGVENKETTWQRTPDNFRKDLEYMYQNGYRMIRLNDYAKGIINTEAGYTPIILTFDDGRQNNFDITEKDGEYVINPDCTIGILEEFKKKHPDFNVTASFFLNSNPFGQQEYTEYKLNWLIKNGYDIGNHTYSHNKMQFMTDNEIKSELGKVNNIVHKYMPDYSVETLALPHGSNPKDEYITNMMEGEYEGNNYKNIAVLDVGWRPAYSPFDTCDDFTKLYRVTASEINVDGCGMYDYFQQFKENKREKFISDGNPDVVTIPKKYEEYINKDMVGTKLLNVYE